MEISIEHGAETIPGLEEAVESGVSLIRFAVLVAVVGAVLIGWQMIRAEWYHKLSDAKTRWAGTLNDVLP